jgi:arylformamidase
MSGDDRSLATGMAPAAPGARVFLDYTQEELDRAYDQRAWAPNADAVIARYGAASEAARVRLRRDADLAYGPGVQERLDIFPAAASPAPILVFLHGGAWRGGTKETYAFPAATLVAAGAHFVCPEFGHIPAVRLPEMADQVRRAIAWVYRNAPRFGGDPERIYLSGHSSGGHLAAVALTTDWTRLGVPATVLKGALCVSGMYDLRAPLLSARSAYVQVTPDEEDALSPQRHVERVRCPVALAVGERESPEFARQARAFAAALAEARRPVEVHQGAGLNHFELLETLGQRDGLLARIALRQMGLVQ